MRPTNSTKNRYNQTLHIHVDTTTIYRSDRHSVLSRNGDRRLFSDWWFYSCLKKIRLRRHTHNDYCTVHPVPICLFKFWYSMEYIRRSTLKNRTKLHNFFIHTLWSVGMIKRCRLIVTVFRSVCGPHMLVDFMDAISDRQGDPSTSILNINDANSYQRCLLCGWIYDRRRWADLHPYSNATVFCEI